MFGLGYFAGYILVYPVFLLTAFILILTLLIGLNEQTRIPPSLKRPVGFTILIFSYKESHLVAQTLKALAESRYPKDFLDVVVITKPSKEDEKDFDTMKNKYRKYGWVKILIHPGSKAAAANFGLDKTKTDWIGLLDADSHIGTDFLYNAARYIQYYDQSDFAGFVGSFSVGNKFQIRETLDTIGSWFNRANFHGTGFFRTNLLRSLKFEEKHPTEDIELSTRIATTGAEVALARGLIVNSNAPTNLRETWYQRRRWARGNWSVLTSHDLWNAMVAAPLRTKIYLLIYHLMSNLAAISLLLVTIVSGAIIVNPKWVYLLAILGAAFYIVVTKELLTDRARHKTLRLVDFIGLLYPFFFVFFLGLTYLKGYMEELLKVNFIWVKTKL